MVHLMRLMVAALATMLLAGCFQVERVVKVKPDGSGTVEETVMFSKKILKSIQDAFKTEGETKAKENDDFGMYDEKSLKTAAKNMGSGVSYLRSEKVSTDKFTGYRSIYAFKDINKLKLDSGPPSMDKKAAPAPDQTASFSFKPAKAGKPATLVLKGAQQKSKVETAVEKPSKQEGEPNPKELEALKEMLDGMRFAFSVVVDGKIIETNATHRDKSRITLADIDFSKILNLSEKDLASLNAVKEQDLAAVMAALKNFPGVKVDLNDEVRVSFTK